MSNYLKPRCLWPCSVSMEGKAAWIAIADDLSCTVSYEAQADEAIPEYVEMKTDDEGLNPDWLGEECRGARFAYVMPTFQNPSGRTISEERRRKLCEKDTGKLNECIRGTYFL